MINDTGGNAFPHEHYHGLTMLDYFAGQVLLGLVMRIGVVGGALLDDLVKQSYVYAEAMVAEKRKREEV